jgi:hypothetical protein
MMMMMMMMMGSRGLGLPCEHGILGAILEARAKMKERHLLRQIDGSTWKHGGRIEQAFSLPIFCPPQHATISWKFFFV